MKKENKKLIENSMLYTGTNILLKCFNFLLLPLYTAYLTKTQYGANTLISSFSTVFSILIVFALDYAVPRFYVEYKENNEKVKRYFGTLLLVSVVSGTLFGGMYFLAHRILDRIFFENISFFPLILTGLIALVFISTQTIYVAILQAMQDGRKAALRSITIFLINFGLILLFVVNMKMGVLGVVMAGLIANALLFIYSVWELRKRNLFTFCIDFNILKENIKYSIFLIPHILSTQVTGWISKIIMNDQFQLGALGVFGLTVQFGSIADTIQSSISAAVKPWIYNHIKEETEEGYRTARKYSLLICWLCCAAFVGVALFSQEVILLFLNVDYAEAWLGVPLVVICYFIKMPYYFYFNLVAYSKKASRKIFIATLSGSIINVLLSVLFIPRGGIYGSLIADIIAMIFRIAIIIFLARNYNVVGYKLREFCGIIIAGIALSGAGLVLSYTKYRFEVSIVNMAYKAAIFLVFVAIMLISNREMISNVLKRRSRRQK